MIHTYQIADSGRGSTMVSMKDIARRCGVSVATVSKALNGLPDIGEETRQRICTVAAEMGYMANSAARALKTRRTYNLGALFVDERRSGLSHEYFSSMLEGFKQEAEAHGYDITFINSNVGDQPVSYLRHCRYRGLDGVLVACVDFTDPRVVELVQSNIPIVTIDHIFPDRQAILSDNVDGLDALVRHAYSKGHRKIALRIPLSPEAVLPASIRPARNWVWRSRKNMSAAAFIMTQLCVRSRPGSCCS